MGNVNRWHDISLAERVVKNLNNNGFHSIYVETKEEARNFIMYHINVGTTVGIGGSETIASLDMTKDIMEKGGTLILHEENSAIEEKINRMREQLLSDVYLCSSNAVTLDGILINIDGAGNRVAAMTFGPKKVIMVIGINKIVKDEKQGIEKLKLSTCPKNNNRLKINNPCIKEGICMECNSRERICRVYSFIKKKPMYSDFSVIMVGEHLGI